MGRRPERALLLVAALVAWWVGNHVVVPWGQRVMHFGRFGHDAQQVLGHWIFWQLPVVILCCAVWWVGARAGLLPSLGATLGSGGSWGRVVRVGLVASLVLLAITVGLGKALGGRFGFHPYYPKMAGDLVSNLYEEIVHRGLMFSAIYGLAAGATFPLAGRVDRVGLVLATVGSCAVFAAGHVQYPLALRVVLGVLSIVFVWPWVRARSLWASWIPHTLGDVIGDSILTL